MSILLTMSGAVGGFALIICIIAGFGMVSAADIPISSPDVAKPGEVVDMYIEDVGVGNTITLNITGQVKTNAGSPVSMQVREISLPVDVSDATMTFKISNIASPGGFFNSSGGGFDVDHALIDTVDGNGFYYHTYGPVDPSASDRYTMAFNATADKDRSVVIIDITGTVDQAITTPAKFSFNVGGFSNGIFNAGVKVMDGATEVAKKNLAFTVQDSLVV